METDFSEIRPFNDAEASAALAAISGIPEVAAISRFIFPDQPPGTLGDILRDIKGVDDFQMRVMSKAVERILETTAGEFSYSGVEYLKGFEDNGRKCLCLSNHRDIVLDPAITQIVLFRSKLPETEIAVGDNLLSNPLAENLIRSNRMIKVTRGVSPKELYHSSMLLSQYIRESITSSRASIWLAQRQGRTKDGADCTEQGLIKMLEMSGSGDFARDFSELDILPLSISYEIEPCGIEKAREKLISRSGRYVKAEGEDMRSILSGIMGQKGDIHMEFCRPLDKDEIGWAASGERNERYRRICHLVDERVIGAYRLRPFNYIACDLLEGSSRHSGLYSAEDVERFSAYLAHELEKTGPELDKEALRDILLHIYSNPVTAKENLAK